MTATTYRTSPRECAAQLQKELSVRNMYMHIGWQWVGRDRAGRIVIKNSARECVYACAYLRGNQRWSPRDANMFVCNTGSQKHEALLHALNFVQAQQSEKLKR